ncbi:MAG: hypothetical protein HUJ26_02170 [Planctomycetaceae bacterium]|nr:hypothetical protein [Planctomycetaceae bacterium]
MKDGENPKVVAALLGHSDIRTTIPRGSHASPDLTLAAVKAHGGQF